MDITTALGVLAGLCTVIITAVINQPHWTPTQKRVTAGVVSTLFGLVAAVASGQVTLVPDTWKVQVTSAVLYVAGVVVVAQGLYSQFKPLIDKLTATTSSPPQPLPSRAMPDPAPVVPAPVAVEVPPVAVWVPSAASATPVPAPMVAG